MQVFIENKAKELTEQSRLDAPVSGPEEVKRTCDAAMEEAEQVHRKRALTHWTTVLGRTKEDFDELFAADKDLGKPPPGYRVRVLTIERSIRDTTSAAHPARQEIPVLTGKFLRAAVATGIEQTVAMVGKMQTNGNWFLWGVQAVRGKHRAVTVHSAAPNPTKVLGDYDAIVKRDAVSAGYTMPAEDRIETGHDELLVYHLHIIDISGRVDEDHQGREVRRGGTVSEAEKIADIFGNRIARAIGGEEKTEDGGERLHHKTRDRYEREIAELKAKLAAGGK